jgi:hypothetical protein
MYGGCKTRNPLTPGSVNSFVFAGAFLLRLTAAFSWRAVSLSRLARDNFLFTTSEAQRF